MQRYLRTLSLIPALLLAAGCTLINSVRPLPAGATPREGATVVVYGVGLQGTWAYPNLGIELDEYNLQTQAITGNCMQFTRMQASVPAAQGTTRYFAFDVAPGHYTYSPFNGAKYEGASVAFEVPAGRVVYIGDFVYGKNQRIELQRDLASVRPAIMQALPELGSEIVLAKTVPVSLPKLFLCAP